MSVVRCVSDYSSGVLDALCWVEKLILGCVDPDLGPLEILDRVIKAVEKVIRDVQEGRPIPDIET